MRGCGKPLLSIASRCSIDYIIKEKTAVLQKKDNEGFGFVLRGAKAQTPIEEFTPTPAFPALQYLESVDEGGVAWRAGLRMGDFLIEVNGQNVVKVGHRQVVNMIRQGGNILMVKVVMVARNPELEDTARKKVNIQPQTKRLTPPAIALRSKSMTSELEDMGEMTNTRHKKKKKFQGSYAWGEEERRWSEKRTREKKRLLIADPFHPCSLRHPRLSPPRAGHPSCRWKTVRTPTTSLSTRSRQRPMRWQRPKGKIWE
uniref:PDZ domain-containing protein n=1 Tax=Hippocampus comes TaxID=109280 RepID=A0A3Q2YBZ7_HIPCM